MKKIIPFIALMAASVTGCKKDNSSGGSATVTYQPVTAGSTWTYETTNNITSPATKTEYTVTATGTDTSINGKTYKVFTSSTGSKDFYYTDGTSYYQYGGIAGITENTELLYLKSNAAVGAGWEETKQVTIPGAGLANVKLSYSYVEKIPSLTVESKTYTDVLHVKITLSDITIGGFPITIASQDLHFYYAPNVGRIKSQIKLTLTPPIGSPIAVDEETNLKAYTIK